MLCPTTAAVLRTHACVSRCFAVVPFATRCVLRFVVLSVVLCLLLVMWLGSGKAPETPARVFDAETEQFTPAAEAALREVFCRLDEDMDGVLDR